MNGPAFSTRAEANFHRMIGADIIGMTNGPEARLCREAEIAAAALALVTDYDCWKEDEAAVEVDTVIENLHANSAMAKQIIRAAVALIPETRTARATACSTQRSSPPAQCGPSKPPATSRPSSAVSAEP